MAFMNPGGLRADIGAAQIAGGEAPGEVTYGEAFTAQPFNNLLVSMDLTGAQLDTLLEQQWNGDRARILSVSQGFRYRYDDRRPLGDRVDGLTLDGKSVDPAATYRITVNSFLADGGDTFAILGEGQRRVTGGVDVDALAAWLSANQPLAVPALDRIARAGAPKQP
ncbi:MAG: 5'-nucleotidase [bacterium]